MITLSQFVSWAMNPQRPIANYSGEFPGECVSLISQYLNQCYGLKPLAWGNAVDYWDNPNPLILSLFNPFTAVSLNFKNGDILIWGQGNYTSQDGHIAIWYQGKLLNQNNDGRKYVTLDPFFQSGFKGILRPRGDNIMGNSMSRDDVIAAYTAVEHRLPVSVGGDVTDAEIATWTGHPFVDFARASMKGTRWLEQNHLILSPNTTVPNPAQTKLDQIKAIVEGN